MRAATCIFLANRFGTPTCWRIIQWIPSRDDHRLTLASNAGLISDRTGRPPVAFGGARTQSCSLLSSSIWAGKKYCATEMRLICAVNSIRSSPSVISSVRGKT